MKFAAVIAFAALALPLAAQHHDFLSSDEVDQIRLAQEPDARVTLYLEFAKRRLELVDQLLQRGKPGRSIEVHDALDDYAKIIDAIDTVGDDALQRKLPVAKGMQEVTKSEKEFLAQLNKIAPSNPFDLSRYSFVLQSAIDATSDSLELSQEDLGKRQSEIASEDKKEEKERESMMRPSEVAERKKAEAAAAEKQRKLPSLYKPGEKKPDDR